MNTFSLLFCDSSSSSSAEPKWDQASVLLTNSLLFSLYVSDGRLIYKGPSRSSPPSFWFCWCWRSGPLGWIFSEAPYLTKNAEIFVLNNSFSFQMKASFFQPSASFFPLRSYRVWGVWTGPEATRTPHQMFVRNSKTKSGLCRETCGFCRTWPRPRGPGSPWSSLSRWATTAGDEWETQRLQENIEIFT